MSDNDLGNILNKFNEMVKNNEVPDNLKDIINNFNNFNNSNNSSCNSSNTDNNSFDIDVDTLLKIKQVMDSINSQKPDPRTNLLLSLKPYLKESRQKKVDQYIKLFNMEKVFETFNSLGGDSKNDV